MPIWFRAYRRSVGRSAVAMTVPRVAAGISRGWAEQVLARARAGASGRGSAQGRAPVRIWDGEHAVMIVGAERELDMVWWQLMRGEVEHGQTM